MRGLARFPGTLLAICLALLAVSLLVLQSASATPGGHFLPYMKRQIVWAGVGLAVFGTLAFVPYPKLTRRAWVWLGLGCVCLLLILVAGTKVNGSRRWFSLGPVRVQPSEFMKYALVLALAHLLARQGSRVQAWGGLLEVGIVTAIPLGLVLLQPDLGTALTYVPIAGALVFAAGARLRHLAALAVAGLTLAPLAWLFVLKSYQKARVLAFLDPSAHSLGGAYQTEQSIIAVGSGGLWGRGYMEGSQGPLGFLPERHTDFVFAVVCEDFGLLGGLGVLALYAYLLLTLARIVSNTRDREGRLVVVGVAAILATQVAVNVGMALGLTPVTGLTLPLVSYGGSSLVANMIGLGLVASVARCRVLVFAPSTAVPRGAW